MTTRRIGIIDSLSMGFALVSRRPFLFLLPILLDLALWFAPSVTLKPLTERLSSSITNAIASAGFSPDQLANSSGQMEQVWDMLGDANLLGILAWKVPSLLGLSTLGAAGRASLATGGWVDLVGLLLVLACAAVFLGSLYLGAIASVVRDSRLEPASFFRRLLPNWVRLVSYLLLILSGVFFLGMGAAVVLGVATLLGSFAFSMALAMVLGFAFLMAVYLFLAEEAIFLSESGPVAAIRTSLALARNNFWSVLGLFLLVGIIGQGLSIIWGILTARPLGVIVAVFGNAYITTGLAAAVMVYYWSRVSKGAQAPSQAQQNTTTER